MVLGMIIVLSLVQAQVSLFNSEIRIQAKNDLYDNGDLTKSYLNAYLQPSSTLHSADWRSIEFTSDGYCYVVSLNEFSNTVESQRGNDCPAAEAASPILLGGYVKNIISDPLFAFFDANGVVVDPSSHIGQVREIDVNLMMVKGMASYSRVFKFFLSS